MIGFFLIFCTSSDSSGVGGFITFKFPFNGDKGSLLSQLSVIIRTPQGNLVDQTDVQPTGYWIIPTPNYRELSISVKAPNGIVVMPQTAYLQFPFNSDVNFEIMGFMVTGNIAITVQNGELMKISAPLTVEISGNGYSLTKKTSSDGTYMIGPLPPGDYSVTILDAVAAVQRVTIVDGLTTCPQLIITEWPQSGKIIFPEGVSPRSISLSLTGPSVQIFSTDNNGFFLLRNLNFGTYRIISAEENIILSPITFTFSSSELPTPIQIKFEGVKIRGSILYPNGFPLPDTKVILQSHGIQTNTDTNGNFIFSCVTSHNHPVIIVEKEFYSFSIPNIKSVTNQPVDPILIQVLDAKISGFIECPTAQVIVTGAVSTKFTINNGSFAFSAPYGKEVTITAKSQCLFVSNSITTKSPSSTVSFNKIKAIVEGNVKCIGKCLNDLKVLLKNPSYSFTTNIEENGSFKLNGVESGQYDFSIIGSRNVEWKINNKNVDATNTNVQLKDIAIQTAFNFNVTSSHQMKVKNGNKIIDLIRGLNTLQTQETIISPSDCHIFNSIDLKENTRIIVTSIEREVIVKGIDISQAKYEVFLNTQKLNLPYKFNQHIDESVNIEVVAVAPYYVEPNKLLVKPISNCNENQIIFEVLKGIEYRGRILPAIEGVQIIAKSNDIVVATVLSNSHGEYSLGSFPSNVHLTLSATKYGYSISKRENSLDFDAVKLASISITFESQNNLISKGILLALSRSDGFKYTITTTSEETFINELEPGTYYLRPLLREYQFTPNQISFELHPSSHQHLNFSVLKTRFGISGEVRRITGEPEPDVEISAIHPNGEKQVEITDSNGYFRIGGLIPDQTYTLISTVSTTTSASKVTPSQLKVKLNNEDFTNIKFVSLKSFSNYDILGEINIDNDFLDSLNIILMSQNGLVVDRFSFPSKTSKFFYFLNLTDDKYNIAIASTRQHSADLNCPRVEVEKKIPQNSIVINCNVVHRLEIMKKPIIASIICFIIFIFWICLFNFKIFKFKLLNLFKKKKAKSSNSSRKIK